MSLRRLTKALKYNLLAYQQLNSQWDTSHAMKENADSYIDFVQRAFEPNMRIDVLWILSIEPWDEQRVLSIKIAG